jgi:hypothetical protein
MTNPTLPEILAGTFGSDFSRATQEQRLLLLETVALSLRKGGGWQNQLRFVCSRVGSQKMPKACFPCIQMTTNEGLQLLATLNVAIVEGFSVAAASESRLP